MNRKIMPFMLFIIEVIMYYFICYLNNFEDLSKYLLRSFLVKSILNSYHK